VVRLEADRLVVGVFKIGQFGGQRGIGCLERLGREVAGHRRHGIIGECRGRRRIIRRGGTAQRHQQRHGRTRHE
jgi:hypothetical protein